MSHLDELDKKILRIIKVDGRVKASEIADILGSTPSTISRKIKKMEEKNVIKGYVSIIEDYDIGKKSRAIFLISTTGDLDNSDILYKITDMDDVCNVYVTMGNYDLVATICTSSESELYRLIKQIRKTEGVLRVDNVSIVDRRKVLSKKITDNIAKLLL
ncbi:MAG: Lrp/AsnC family transcriptional regulator [Chloroflexi bacterium]|nr:Lrp/AsnC family transcriptional regulator [Chloroflexota bacterium]MBL7079308.1 Lrp/AsnC family transcriptional regulator [Candidatus Bathyarchaeota archaeon]